MSMTAKAILAKCPQEVVQRSAHVKIVKSGITQTKQSTTVLTANAYSTRTNDGKPVDKPVHFEVSVEKLKPGKLTSVPVKISCSCPNFAFTWEYALHKQGAADIFHSNGDPAVVKNPRSIPGCCHHLYKFLSGLLAKGV